MDDGKAVLSLIFLTVIASGCIPGGGGGSEPAGSITVDQLKIKPAQIYSGQSIRVWVEISNTGALPATVKIGKQGREIIQGFCEDDVFKMVDSGFSASTSADSSVTGDELKQPIKMKPGYKMRVRWRLKNTGNTPLYGDKCPLKFSVPFNYSVSAYRQVQVKKDREVKGSSNLQYETTSGPLTIQIGTISGSTGKKDTFIVNEGEENRNVTFVVRFINSNPEEDYSKGLVDIDESSMKVDVTGPLKPDDNPTDHCDMPETDLRLDKGKSRDVMCTYPLPKKSNFDTPSKISEFSVSVNYTYEKDIGSRTVKVKSRGQ